MHDPFVHYVYLIKSISNPTERYIGTTADLKRRIAEHSSGKSPHTSKHAPWTLITYVAFSIKQQADKFERFLKSSSGHAFANRHLW